MVIEMIAMLLFGKDPLAVPSFSGDEPVQVFGASFVPAWRASRLTVREALAYE